MVNVPGRSKGCNTCRKRKKGCDLGKPACSRCLNDNLQCEGYARPIIFVSHEPQPKTSRTVAKRPRPRSYLDQALYHVAVSSPTADASLTRISIQDGTFNLFWEHYLPKGKFVPPGGLETLTHYAWVEALQKLSTESVTLRLALCAVSLSNIAVRTADKALMTQGAELYGSALSRLNSSLQNPHAAARDDAVIPTISILSMYEQFNGFSATSTARQGSNWHTHSVGIARLFHIRGPELQASDYGHIMWSICRPSQFATAFMARKSSPFASAEWKSIPWSNRPKPARDVLFDILIDLPGLLEMTDITLDDASSNGGPLGVTTMKCLLSTLFALNEWQSSLTASLVPELQSATYRENSNSWSPDPEWYMDQGMDIATWMLQLWSARLVICATIRILGEKLGSTHAFDTTKRDGFDPHTHALNLLRCIPKLSSADAGILTFQCASLHIGIVLTYFATFGHADERVKLMIQSLVKESNGPYGSLILSFLEQTASHVHEGSSCGTNCSEQGSTKQNFVRETGRKWFRISNDSGNP